MANEICLWHSVYEDGGTSAVDMKQGSSKCGNCDGTQETAERLGCRSFTTLSRRPVAARRSAAGSQSSTKNR